MAAMTTYYANALLNHTLRGVAFAMPAQCYLAIFTTPTTDAGEGIEVTGGSYARQPITATVPNAKETSNQTAPTFQQLPGVTVTHIGIMDALTGGNMLLHGQLDAPVTVPSGENLTFPIGSLDLTYA